MDFSQMTEEARERHLASIKSDQSNYSREDVDGCIETYGDAVLDNSPLVKRTWALKISLKPRMEDSTKAHQISDTAYLCRKTLNEALARLTFYASIQDARTKLDERTARDSWSRAVEKTAQQWGRAFHVPHSHFQGSPAHEPPDQPLQDEDWVASDSTKALSAIHRKGTVIEFTMDKIMSPGKQILDEAFQQATKASRAQR